MQRSESQRPEACRRERNVGTKQDEAQRIPRELESPTEGATIRTADDVPGVEHVRRRLALADVLSTLSLLEEDFPRIADPAIVAEDIL